VKGKSFEGIISETGASFSEAGVDTEGWELLLEPGVDHNITWKLQFEGSKKT
jgi:hypothetical protein